MIDFKAWYENQHDKLSDDPEYKAERRALDIAARYCGQYANARLKEVRVEVDVLPTAPIVLVEETENDSEFSCRQVRAAMISKKRVKQIIDNAMGEPDEQKDHKYRQKPK